MNELTHFDEKGNTRMVDVGEKPQTLRIAVATGHVSAKKETLQKISNQETKKGNVLEVAKIAGYMAAKRTSEIIPLCHPLTLTSIRVDLTLVDGKIEIEAEVQTIGRTGVEMEALTAVSVAGLTVYDMCKAIDREMCISDVKLVKKTGGKSGDFNR